MSPSFWSDENRFLVPRLGGWSINFKFVAKKLGWIKTQAAHTDNATPVNDGAEPQDREERLRKAIEESRYEDR